MSAQDAMQLKEKILMLLNRKGPSLPVHIARETGLSILFSSAFLSELVADKKIKISYLRVGSSPIYFLPEHFSSLERFSEHLKSKEKEAYLLLKEHNFLKDAELPPAIRIALREIKDFAIPLQKNNELYWRYFTVSEQEFKQELIEIKKPEILEIKEEKPVEIIPRIIEVKKGVEYDEENNEEEVGEENEEVELKEVPRVGVGGRGDGGREEIKHKPQKLQKEKQRKIKKQTKKPQKKANDTFFNKIKEILASKNIEIIDIESFNNSELILKVKEGRQESLLIAYNKKRLSESDIVNAYKKASGHEMPYKILTLGETSKKLSSFIDAIKGMSGLERVE